MKFISWNVNGIRAVLKKGLLDFLNEQDADFYCFQEIKAYPEQIGEVDWPEGYHKVWNPAERKGYSGTAIFAKHEPLSVELGMGYEEHDNEGRVITLEYENFYLVTVYTPNAKGDLSRLDYRYDTWDVLFLEHMKKLEEKKPVVVCGDLNVAHKEIDLARPKPNVGSAGFTNEEREGFDNFVAAGFIDTFREFNQEGGHYSWWSYRAGARQKNVGWRIDYFLTSGSMKDDLKNAYILPEVMGSDHCPVVLEI